jgi:hypothetical protein
MVGELSSNWGKLDPTTPKDKKKDNWVSWRDEESMRFIIYGISAY